MNAIADAGVLGSSLHWINCGPQSLEDHRGKVLALVFWHAGSVYCDNLLADLQHLQRKHAEGLDVIAVHTPKFEAERSARLVQKAVNRLALGFPVALDGEFALWQQFGIGSWPTVLLFDPAGQRGATIVGDMQRDAIDRVVVQLLERTPLKQRQFKPQAQCSQPETRLPLAFPAGIAVNANHLYVVDSGHHRVLECTHDGRVLRQFGSGTAGLVDGSATEGCFRHPRGLHLTRDTLFVADTGNHALRRIRLMDGEIDTLAGTGRPGMLAGTGPVPAAGAALNAPWNIAGNFEQLFIAMAGAQQVWAFDQSDRSLKVLAGDGRMALVDGGGEQCAFAQPADLALVDDSLYVVDAAASALRGLHLPSRAVHTLAGQGLFEFGDADGVRSQALMQYPMAVARDSRMPSLWIADSYNNSLRTLRLTSGELRRHELDYRLHEPAALATSAGVLWIANTNAHEVLRIDLDRNQVRRLPIGE